VDLADKLRQEGAAKEAKHAKVTQQRLIAAGGVIVTLFALCVYLGLR
jgi:hypothetical protein